MNSINKKEIEKFSKIAEEWWNPNGKFKPLHNFNPIRIKYIKDNIVKDFNIKYSNRPLRNIRILDIGCGGGLLSEPMSRLGASVVGIDASKKKNAKKNFYHVKDSLPTVKAEINSIDYVYNSFVDKYDKFLENKTNFLDSVKALDKTVNGDSEDKKGDGSGCSNNPEACEDIDIGSVDPDLKKIEDDLFTDEVTKTEEECGVDSSKCIQRNNFL